jgi:hypothetical protein
MGIPGAGSRESALVSRRYLAGLEDLSMTTDPMVAYRNLPEVWLIAKNSSRRAKSHRC